MGQACYDVQILRSSTCEVLTKLEEIRASGGGVVYCWTPDSTRLLVVTSSISYGSTRSPIDKLYLVDVQQLAVTSSAVPPTPLRAVLGCGHGRQGLELLCAGESAAGADNPCPVVSLSVQGSSWSSAGSPIAGAAVFVTPYSGALAALSPSAKHLAIINAASLSSAWSVQLLNIAAGSVVAEWAAPAGAVLGQAAHSISLEWAQSGQRLVVKTARASFLVELESSG